MKPKYLGQFWTNKQIYIWYLCACDFAVSGDYSIIKMPKRKNNN